MKHLYLYHLLVIIFLFFLSCNEERNSDSQQFSSSTDATSDTYRSTEINIQRQRDSIERIEQKRIADSIEAEKQYRLKMEDIERKSALAWPEIESFSKTLMHKVSPLSGEKLDCEVNDEELEYDDLTKTLTIPFWISWYAYPTYNPNDIKEEHVYEGTFKVYENGTYLRECTSKNPVLIKAINATNAMNDVLDWIERSQSTNPN